MQEIKFIFEQAVNVVVDKAALLSKMVHINDVQKFQKQDKNLVTVTVLGYNSDPFDSNFFKDFDPPVDYSTVKCGNTSVMSTNDKTSSTIPSISNHWETSVSVYPLKITIRLLNIFNDSFLGKHHLCGEHFT